MRSMHELPQPIETGVLIEFCNINPNEFGRRSPDGHRETYTELAKIRTELTMTHELIESPEFKKKHPHDVVYVYRGKVVGSHPNHQMVPPVEFRQLDQSMQVDLQKNGIDPRACAVVKTVSTPAIRAAIPTQAQLQPAGFVSQR